MAIPTSGANNWFTLNNVPLSFSIGADNLAAKARESSRNLFRITVGAPDDLEIWVEGEMLETERYGSWLWKPKQYAGLYRIELRAPRLPQHFTHVRVLPNKLSYERYEQMLQDISAISVDLLLQLESPAAENFSLDRQRNQSSALREYELINSVIGELAQVMAQLRRSPHRTLVERREDRRVDQVRQFTPQAQPLNGPVMRISARPSDAQKAYAVPEHWLVGEPSLTYDTHENQLLKHFLWRQLLPRLHSIVYRAENEIRRRTAERSIKLANNWFDDETEHIQNLELVVDRCKTIGRHVTAWGGDDFLQSVSSLTIPNQPTQVLQKHPAYSRFFRIYLLYQRELARSLDPSRFTASLALRKMWELYQIWSVFQVTQIVLAILVQAGYQCRNQDFFHVRDDEFHVNVARGTRIELEHGSTRILVCYDPLYLPAHKAVDGIVSGDSVQRTPDMSIEVWRQGQPPRVIILDAKYKSELKNSVRTFVNEDLDKMARYLQILRWKSPSDTVLIRQVATSAYILYPGEVLEHDTSEAEVGALPLIPKAIRLGEIQPVVKHLLGKAGAFGN